MPNSIKCGHCKGYHNTTRDVFFCAQRPGNVPINNAVRAAPENPWTLSTPRAMVESVRDGRYAVRGKEDGSYFFLRVSRPTHGKLKGALVVQSQHSDFYKHCLVIHANGRVSVLDRRIDQPLLMAAVDPITATRAYASELGVCGRCGRELTDERSRYYGIGPECEKHWPDLIQVVNDEKGVYYVGKI